jgi:para-nitrobenzyl esterase
VGDPGRGRGGDLPQWKPWDPRPGVEKTMLLDTEAGGGLRMSDETVTREAVVAAVDGDARLTSQRERCAVFYQLADWGRGFEREDYPRAGAQGCAEYPWDEYPWNGAR